MGEKNEISTNQTEINGVDETINVDNVKYIDFNDEPQEIRELLTRIDNAFKNIAIENDYARLSMLVEYLNNQGKTFNPKEYGHPNKGTKDFFEKRLGKYFDIDTKNSTTFIKFKAEVKK